MSYSFSESSKKRNLIIAGIIALVVLGALLYFFKFKAPETTGKTVLTNPSQPEQVVSKSPRFRLEHTFGEVAAVPESQD